jgi:hypothetical protein
MDLFTRNSSLNPLNAACLLYLSFYNGGPRSVLQIADRESRQSDPAIIY